MRRPFKKIPLNKLSIVALLLIITLLLHRYIGSKYKSSIEEFLTANHQDFIAHRRDKFVWSEELQSWTIDYSFAVSDTTETKASRCLWPEDCASDRIIEQLLLDEQSNRTFKIHIQKEYNLPEGSEVFFSDNCSVNKCELTYDLNEADAIVFQNADVFREPKRERRSQQVWIAYLLESPVNTFDKRLERKYRGKHVFNWTASYRSDSDIVTPYSKFLPYSSSAGISFGLVNKDRVSSLIRHKRSKIAWLVSNCRASNNRFEVAKKLSEYIQLDIFGSCGNKTCSKSNHSDCLKFINENYKFYLSFENSNCKEYITEKFYHNALGYNDLSHMIVPIVMGPKKEDYLRLSPPNSFIHVDDFGSVKDLADYLNKLDKDDSQYGKYFQWKTTGRFVDTKFLCRICAMLHWSDLRGKSRSYESVRDWWTKGLPTGQQTQCT